MISVLNDRLFGLFEARPISRVAFATGWSLLFIVGVLASVSPTYKVNDNAGILMMMQEGLEAPYMTQLLISTLGFLFRSVSGSVPWFGLANYFALFWALSLFVHSLSTIERAKPLFLPLAALFTIIFTTFVMRCGYNSSSIVLSGVSVLAFAAYARERKVTRWTLLACALGLAYAFLFRPRGMQGAMIIIAPALLAFGAWKRDRYSLAMLLMFAAPIATVGTVHYVWNTWGMSEGYQEFRKFNRLRGKFHVYPISLVNRDNPKILEANGWQKNHYMLLNNWFFIDEDRWNVETMQNIFEHTLELPHESLSTDDFGVAGEFLWNNYRQFTWLVPLLVTGLLLTRRSPWAWLWSLGYFWFLFFLAGYMCVVLRFPDRVGDPLFTVAVAGFIWICLSGKPGAPWSDKRVTWATRAAFGAAFWFATLGGLDFASRKEDGAIPSRTDAIGFLPLYKHEAEYTAARARQFNVMFEGFNTWFEGKIVYAQPAILLTLDQHPLGNYEYEWDGVPTGWRTFSPLFYKFLNRHGLERGADLMRFAVDNPDFYFVFMPGLVRRILEFIDNDYGIHCKVMEYVELSTSRFLVFRLETDEDPPADPAQFRVERVKTGYGFGGVRRPKRSSEK